MRDGTEVLQWPVLDSFGLDALVTTRSGGVSRGPYASLNLGFHVGDDPAAVLENRRRAARILGADPEQLVFAQQVHGAGVATVDESHAGRGASGQDPLEGADALVTRAPEIGLVILVADCVPVVLVDPGASVLACAHAGWRGTVAGVLGATLDAMVTLGAEPDRIVAGVGPAIDASRYQVGDDVAGAVRERFGDQAAALLAPDGTGRYLFDLRAATRHALLAAGVAAPHIHAAPQVTGPGGPFFSARAAQPCGRFGALARLRA